MSIASSLYSGISGLSSNANAMTVIGNNIANSNTNGFKSGRVDFADVISQSIASSSPSSQVGRGTQVANVTTYFGQGSLASTENVTDMAIEGDGFFVVNDGTSNFYTRDGAFDFDRNEDMVNAAGLVVQGWFSDTNGNATGALTDMNFSGISSTPSASSTTTINANFGAGDAIVPAFDVLTPDTTSNFATGITLYDSLGSSHTATVYFSKTAANAWAWNAVVPAADHTTGTNTITATGALTFLANGSLDLESQTVNDFDFAGSPTQNQSIIFDFGDSITTDGGTGLAGSTQFGSTSAVSVLNQNGFGAGDLQSIAVDSGGLVTGFFTNGNTQPIALIALADFTNRGGLSKVGNNLYGETFNSGQPVIVQAGTSGLGKIQSNSVEQSNVDLAQEFVRMITTQRGFQANSRTISVTDEMMAEVINIKR